MATIDEFLDNLGISGEYTTSEGEYTLLLYVGVAMTM